VIAAILAAAIAAPGGACDAPLRRLPEPVRGIVVPLHDLDPRRSYRAAVAEVAASGATAVSIMPVWEMPRVGSPRVRRGAATRRQIEDALAAARRAGLAILVAPALRIIDPRPGEWRGVIRPPDWEVWFASYRDLLLELAAIAEEYDAEALLVGSELCSSEAEEGHWRRLIADVRQVFRGSLAYQANWDHREVPRFLDALDQAGTNAYFELGRDVARPSVGLLTAAWWPHRDRLVAWARSLGRPLLITEIGYPSVAGAAAFPWDHTRRGPIDLEAQRRAYEAFFAVWMDEPALAGFFVYEWWGEGGAADPGYTPRGKPALEVLRRWFARPAAIVGSSTGSDRVSP
jgi:hypothetical protein